MEGETEILPNTDASRPVASYLPCSWSRELWCWEGNLFMRSLISKSLVLCRCPSPAGAHRIREGPHLVLCHVPQEGQETSRVRRYLETSQPSGAFFPEKPCQVSGLAQISSLCLAFLVERRQSPRKPPWSFGKGWKWPLGALLNLKTREDHQSTSDMVTHRRPERGFLLDRVDHFQSLLSGPVGLRVRLPRRPGRRCVRWGLLPTLLCNPKETWTCPCSAHSRAWRAWLLWRSSTSCLLSRVSSPGRSSPRAHSTLAIGSSNFLWSHDPSLVESDGVEPRAKCAVQQLPPICVAACAWLHAGHLLLSSLRN